MTDNHLAPELAKHLKKCGVASIERHDGKVQFLGKYGTINLYKDIATLQPQQIEKLYHLIELIRGRPSPTFGQLPRAFPP